MGAQDVAERRGKVKRYNTDPEFKKQVDEDKRARAKAQRKEDPPVSLFDIVIPLAPFGIPGSWYSCVVCLLLMLSPMSQSNSI